MGLFASTGFNGETGVFVLLEFLVYPRFKRSSAKSSFPCRRRGHFWVAMPGKFPYKNGGDPCQCAKTCGAEDPVSISRAVLPALSLLVLSLGGAMPAKRLAEGSAAPPFALLGTPSTGSAAGAPSLVVFLDFSEGDLGARPDDGPSGTEAEALRTVLASYDASTLRAVLVDAAPTVHRRTPAVEELATRVRAWGLERFPVVQDHDRAGLARRYGVSRIPCVFLVDGRGIVRGRWDGFVSAGELAGRIDLLQRGSSSSRESTAR
jgi:hypothetical protein